MQQQQQPGGGPPLAAAGLSSLLMHLASTVRKKAAATAAAAAEAPPKRGRGRPRKHPLPPVAHHAPNSALVGGPGGYAAYAARSSFHGGDESSDEDPVPVTARHQALLPPLRPLPPEPPPSEARYLAAPFVYDAHAHTGSAAPAPPISASEFKALYRATFPESARRALLADVIEALNQQMGPQLVQDLGLSLLGANLQQTWQPHEELLFCLGMCDKYRMFKYIRQCYLRARSVHELNGYYHNVWKTRSSAVAEGFLGLRDAGADHDDLEAFAEGIRQQLTAIWDVQRYGSMPPMAASPQARALLANQQQQQQNMGRGSSNSLMSGSYMQHTAAAGASRGLESTSFAAAAAPPPRAAAEVGKARADAEAHPAQQQQQQQQQQPRITVLSLKPQGGQQAGTPGRVRLLPTLPPPQQPASAASPAGHSGDPHLQLPALPDLPMPNAAMSVESWLQALPGYRQDVADFKQQVAQQCDSATQQEQQRIQQLQATCAASLQQADAAAQAVSGQEQQLIAQLELRKQQQQHAAAGEPAAQRQKQAGAGAGPQQQPSAQTPQSVHAHHIKVAAAAAAGAAAALKSAGRPAVPMEQLQGAVMQLLQQEQVRQQAAPSQPKRSGSSRQRPRVHVTWCHPHPTNAAAVKQEAPVAAGAAAGAAVAANARKRPVGAASLPGAPAQDSSSASAGKKQRHSPSTASMSVTPQDADTAAAPAAAASDGASQDDAACLAY